MNPQSETERVLEERLAGAGVHVERCVELTNLVAAGDGVVATLVREGGRTESVCCAWLLGCDGAHSTVRHQLGLTFSGEVEPNDWILADAHVSGPLAADEVSLFW